MSPSKPPARVTVERHLDAVVCDDFLAFYREAFEPLRTETAVEQTVSDAEFRELAARRDVLKFVGWDDDGQPISLSLVTTNLGLVPWISVPFYERRFPEHYARNAIYYFVTLVIAPDHQDGPLIRAMLEALSLYIAMDRGVIAFDTCQYNIDVFAVPQVIERLGRRYVHGETSEIDAQHYYAYVLQGIKEIDLRDQTDHGIVIDLTDQERSMQPQEASE